MQDKIRIDILTGLYIEVVHPNITGEDIIETPSPSGLYLPKWNGTEWVEGMAQADIDLLKANAIPTEPTLEQKVAEQELVINDLLTLLADKGVIY